MRWLIDEVVYKGVKDCDNYLCPRVGPGVGLC